MSTHNLDVSGQRALTVTVNDPARTAASTSAKAGDDVTATLSGFRELRVELPDNARIQRRRYVRKDVVYENGKPKPAPEGSDQPYETVDVEYEKLVVVVASLTLFGRTSIRLEETGEEGVPTYESTPHTNIVARKNPDLHFLESGELVEETTLAELRGSTEAEV